MDKNSNQGKQYALNWHQTGHAFFIGGDPLMINHSATSDVLNTLIISAIFSHYQDELSGVASRVRLQQKSEPEVCPNVVEIWRDERWISQPPNCKIGDIYSCMYLTVQCYESYADPYVNPPAP